MPAAADAAIAAELNVPTVAIERLRKEMDQGKHWNRDEAGKIVFTPEGREFILSRLASITAEHPPHRQVPSRAFTLWPQIPHATVEQLMIVRIHPNPRFVKVQLKDKDKTTVDVRVRDNRHLRVRAKLECRQLPDGRWECCHRGQAAPAKPKAAA